MQVIQLAEEQYTGSIISRIRSATQEADVMVAVASKENGNVYYEIGLAHCQQKPVAILTTDPAQLKFDLRDHRAIRYDPDNPRQILQELVSTLHAATTEFPYPHDYFQNVFRGQSLEASVEQGVDAAKDSGRRVQSTRAHTSHRASSICERGGLHSCSGLSRYRGTCGNGYQRLYPRHATNVRERPNRGLEPTR